ncbi:hypothetical protein J2Y48_004037 [Mycoplana sp. BE70]|nr:hypothetical protein [Mycoplana sp. BE70]
MTANRVLLSIVPAALMIAVTMGLTGVEQWFAPMGKTEAARLMLGRIGIATPYIAAAAIGFIWPFASAGSASIRFVGWSTVAGNVGTILVAVARETSRLAAFADEIPEGKSVFAYLDPATMIGAAAALMVGCFALRVAVIGNAAFGRPEPKRIVGKRALHGEADWMKLTDATRLFGDTGGIVVGERYRVDRDGAAARGFRADDKESWGDGGKAPLLCFDGSFGSSHGIVFAGSGGFKTTSVTIPTALKWGGTLIVLDPSNEVAPMVSQHREGGGAQDQDPRSAPAEDRLQRTRLDRQVRRHQGRGHCVRRVMDHERERSGDPRRLLPSVRPPASDRDYRRCLFVRSHAPGATDLAPSES